MDLFHKMHREGCKPNVVTYNSLIAACAHGGHWEKATELFEQMQKEGCKPDGITFAALISAYEKGGQWRRALQALELMQAQGCHPDAAVFNSLMDVLWQSGVVLAQVRPRATIGCFLFVHRVVSPTWCHPRGVTLSKAPWLVPPSCSSPPCLCAPLLIRPHGHLPPSSLLIPFVHLTPLLTIVPCAFAPFLHPSSCAAAVVAGQPLLIRLLAQAPLAHAPHPCPLSPPPRSERCSCGRWPTEMASSASTSTAGRPQTTFSTPRWPLRGAPST